MASKAHTSLPSGSSSLPCHRPPSPPSPPPACPPLSSHGGFTQDQHITPTHRYAPCPPLPWPPLPSHAAPYCPPLSCRLSPLPRPLTQDQHHSHSYTPPFPHTLSPSTSATWPSPNSPATLPRYSAPWLAGLPGWIHTSPLEGGQQQEGGRGGRGGGGGGGQKRGRGEQRGRSG